MSLRFDGCRCALTVATALAAAAPAHAAVITPDDVSVVTPAGSTDTTSPFTDDVLLESLRFGTTTYDGTGGAFSVARRFEVLTGRDQINAEWGDTDTAADGDPDPFTKAGFPAGDQETTDPAVQDQTLLNAFNSRSLSEITDGEGQSRAAFKVLFEQSLAFDDVGGDGLPDLVFFERGRNDVFEVELITGGSFANPTLSAPLTIDSAEFSDAEFAVNTLEIGNAQTMGVGGLDLSDFGLGPGDSAFGFRLTTDDGPDLGGFFLAAENPETFGSPLDEPLPGEPVGTVPLPSTGWMLLGSLALGALARRRVTRA